jgi:hypothetical protein
LINLQVNLERMRLDHAKMEKSSLEQQGIITGLEHTCQDLKEHWVATYIEIDKGKQSLIAQIQD